MACSGIIPICCHYSDLVSCASSMCHKSLWRVWISWSAATLSDNILYIQIMEIAKLYCVHQTRCISWRIIDFDVHHGPTIAGVLVDVEVEVEVKFIAVAAAAHISSSSTDISQTDEIEGWNQRNVLLPRKSICSSTWSWLKLRSKLWRTKYPCRMWMVEIGLNIEQRTYSYVIVLASVFKNVLHELKVRKCLE